MKPRAEKKASASGDLLAADCCALWWPLLLQAGRQDMPQCQKVSVLL
jgi:hypothetical protein